MLKHPLRGWRSADIAHADEEYPNICIIIQFVTTGLPVNMLADCTVLQLLISTDVERAARTDDYRSSDHFSIYQPVPAIFYVSAINS
jgi:hypothetical protein